MCERCGYSGCRHDWLRWDRTNYNSGYGDGYNGREFKEPAAPGYIAGFQDGKFQRRQQEKYGTEEVEPMA